MGGPSAAAYAAAAVLWLLVGVVPGLLVGTVLAPDRSRLDRLAVAPLVSIAVGFAPASWLSALGVPQAWHAAWVAPLLVSVALVVVLARRGDLAPLLAMSRPVAVVVGAWTLAAVVWVLGIALSTPGWGAVVPDQDGGSHGVFVTRILLSGSVAPDQVAVFDLADPAASSVFYPLGIHALAAPVAAVTSVPSALLVAMTLLGSGSLVVGTAALARRIGGPRLLAPAAVTAAVLVPWFPFSQAFWGPVPLILGVACVPGLLLALLDARLRRDVLLAGLAVAGMLALHTTEVLVAVGLAVLAVLLGASPARTSALLRTAGSVLVGAALVAPVVVGLLSGGASRPQEPAHEGDAFTIGLWMALRAAVAADSWRDPTAAQLAASVLAGAAVMALAVAGAVRLRRSPLALSLVVAIVGCLVVGGLARVGVARLLSVPWYGNADRLAAQASALLPVLVGAGWLALRERARSRAATAMVAGAAACVALVLAAQSVASVVDGFGRFSVVTDDDRAAYAWLADHARTGERVLNDHRDGSLWLYDAGRGAAAPVFGPKPSGGWELVPAFAGALHLRDHVGDLAADPQVREEASALSIRYVLVGSRSYDDAPPLLDAEAMAASPAFREVFRSGDARVFEIVGG